MTNKKDFAEKIIKKASDLAAKRQTLEAVWQEVSDLVLPRKASFFYETPFTEVKARKLYETTAVNAAELLASGLHGMLTNPAGKWFSLTAVGMDKNQSSALSDWMGKAERIMTEEISRPAAGFATNMHEVYLDLAVLGTAGIYVGWDDRNTGILFQSRFLAELFIDEDATGRVTTIYRRFKFTLSKIVEVWGAKVLTRTMRSDWDGGLNLDKEYSIIHAIYPNKEYTQDDFRLSVKKPVASVYVLEEEKHILFSGGFEEMPLFVPRWAKVSSEVYGRSPAISALPDIKMIQEMMKETIIAAQLANRPPLLVRDDDQFAPVATIPGGIIRYSGEAPKAFVSGANFAAGWEIMSDIKRRIRVAFFNDQLMFENDVRMTATEVIQRTEEKMRLMGPIAGRLQSELLGPMIERVFGLLLRHGKIPPPPENLSMKIEYLSPLAMAQKQTDAASLSRVLEVSAGFLEIQPEAAIVFDSEKAIRHIAEVYGQDDILRDSREVQRIKEEQAAMMEQAQAMNQQAQGLQMQEMAADIGQKMNNLENGG